MACKVYKIVNDLSPQYISDLVNIKVPPYDFRGEKKADIPRENSTRYGLRSFRSPLGSGTGFRTICVLQNRTRSSED